MSDDPTIAFYQADAFTDRPYGGNPAAVCLLQGALEESAMQRIAAEMNLSETAFVEPPDGGGERRLRWFTPAVEVSLCGHATLATAHVLLNEAGEEPPLRFRTASGLLTVVRGESGLSMDFPADPPRKEHPPPGLVAALRCDPPFVTLRGIRLWVVRLADEDAVRRVRPDFAELAKVDLGDGRLGVTVTAPGSGGVDFVSRFFAPWVGIEEDPVTGAAHTALAPYWAEQTGRARLRARQVSRRGGDLVVTTAGDRVRLEGHAVTVARGRLVLPEG